MWGRGGQSGEAFSLPPSFILQFFILPRQGARVGGWHSSEKMYAAEVAGEWIWKLLLNSRGRNNWVSEKNKTKNKTKKESREKKNPKKERASSVVIHGNNSLEDTQHGWMNTLKRATGCPPDYRHRQSSRVLCLSQCVRSVFNAFIKTRC